MRITQNMSADNSLFNIQKGRAKLDRLQEQISAKQNYLRPSDDPITTRNILELENRVKQSDQRIKNIQNANIWMDITNTALESVADTLKNIKSVVAGVSGGTSNTSDGASIRQDAVSQLKEWRQMLVDLGNTKSGDQYIFAGFKNSVNAFAVDTLTSPPLPSGDPLIGEPSATWQGSSDLIQIDVGSSSPLGISVGGDAVFKGMSNGVTPGSYGGLDIFATIDSVIRAISSNNTNQIQLDEKELAKATNQLQSAIGDLSGKMTRSQSAENLANRTKNTALNSIAERQNLDFAKAAVELKNEMFAYEASLSSMAKIAQISLMDFLR